MKWIINRMTRGMLWTITVPTAIFIIMLSGLLMAYIKVILISNEVIYEGAVGKVTVKINRIEKQLNEVVLENSELTKIITNIITSLESTYPPINKRPDESNQVNKNELNILKNYLEPQLNILKKQREKLDSVINEVNEFKSELKTKKIH